VKLHKRPGKVVEVDIENEIQIWSERQLETFCLAVPLPIQA